MKRFFLIIALFLPFCAFAQFEESFNGPEISTANTWTGNVSAFKINAGNQLQLNADESVKESTLAYYSVSALSATIWQCWAKLDFKSTSNNYARVFLWSSDPDATKAQDAYFVRVGYTKNEVALCQRMGGKEKVLISSASGILHTTSVSIKVIADLSGTWSLQIKEAGEGEYREVGSRSLNLKDQKEGYFLLNCKFTKNIGRNKMYFDAISIRPFTEGGIEPEEPDTPDHGLDLAPIVETQSATELIVTLDKPMNLDEAIFTLSGIGEAEEYWISEDNKFLKLIFGKTMQQGKKYRLSWQAVQDMDGVSVKNDFLEFTFGTTRPEEPEEPEQPTPETPISIHPLDIIINEVLFDPLAGGSEYIELYNRSDKLLSLNSLFFATRKKNGTLSLHYPLAFVGEQIKPNTCLLVTKSIEGVTSCYDVPETALLYEGKLPVLANTGATIVLADTSGTVIDELSYSPDWHSPLLKSTKGVALERTDPEVDTQNSANWSSASPDAGNATPGYANSKYTISSDPSENDQSKGEGIDFPVRDPSTHTYTVSYHLNQPGYSYKASIFDVTGKEIVRLPINAQLPMEGTITWNARQTGGRIPSTGIYLFYVEFFHPEGKTLRFKKAFPVR